MKKLTLAAIAALVFGLFTISSLKADDFTFRDGFWWSGGAAYTRTQVWNPVTYTRDYYGRLYANPQTYYWSYARVPVIVKKVQLPAKAPVGWRTQLLELAKQRDLYEGKMRLLAVDQKAYIDSIAALGLTGNYKWEGYGTSGYGSQSLYSSRSTSYGASGLTQYGYSVKSVREMYGETNLNTLYQQSARLTAGAQALAGKANTEFSGLVSAAGDNAARVAEILAQAEAAERALKAARLPASTKETTTITGSGTAALPPPRPVEEDLSIAAATDFLKTVGIPRCASCHSGNTIKGGFDILKYPTMTDEAKSKVWERIITKDETKRMPRLASGAVGPKLTPAEQKKFFAN